VTGSTWLSYLIVRLQTLLYFIGLNDLFKTQTNKDELNNFLRTKGWNITNNQAAIKTPMGDDAFNELLFNVRANLLQFLKVSYETEVFNNANNYFTTNQVRQLLLLINAENNRLDLAKLSYKTVTDPGNFSQLNNIFHSQSSRDDLASFVKNYAKINKLIKSLYIARCIMIGCR
jgi:hypothetical protein